MAFYFILSKHYSVNIIRYFQFMFNNSIVVLNGNGIMSTNLSVRQNTVNANNSESEIKSAVLQVEAHDNDIEKIHDVKIVPESVNYHFTRTCNYSCGFCFHTAKTSFNVPLEKAKQGLEMLVKAGMKKVMTF